MTETNKITTAAQRIWALVKRIWHRVQEEPVLVRTVLALLVSGGVLELTGEQLDRIDSIVIVLIMLFGAASARRVVTPLPPEERPRLVRRKRGSDE